MTTRRPTVMFAFDDVNIPWTRGVQLEMQLPEKHPANPVVERGREGGPDCRRATSPCVVREGNLWRMWYGAKDDSGDAGGLRLAYAESDDGVVWRKPNLGLVEYHGSRANNLVDAQPGLNTVSVLHDPDAVRERRYCLAGEDMRYWHRTKGWSLDGPSITRIDTSPEGFHWAPVIDGPGIIAQQNETHALYSFGGYYHVGGHQISPLLRLPMQEHALGGYLGPRTFVVWRSRWLDRWPEEHTKAFYKPMRSSSPYLSDWDREEVHLGADIVPFENVCIGVYGQWHHPVGAAVGSVEAKAVEHVEGGYQDGGEIQYHGPTVSVDLGLILSNDGLHFREPAPGYTLIRRDQERTWDRDFRDNDSEEGILLIQGSMVSTDRRTHIYYSAGTPVGNTAHPKGFANIGLATLPRDRYGCLQAIPGSPGGGSCVTAPLRLAGPTELCANVEVPQGSSVRCALLDEDGLSVMEGYGAGDLAERIETGLDVSVRWRDRSSLPVGTAFRIRVELSGDARLFALYLR